MSDALRRALADAAGSPPPVDDWLTPVRLGVRLRRRRRAVQQAGAGTALAVAAGLLGASLLPTRASDQLLPPPVPSPSPSAAAPASPSPAARPAQSPGSALPARPSASPSALPRLSPRPAGPSAGGAEQPGPAVAAPGAAPRPSASPSPSSARPAAPPSPLRSPAASPAPTAGAQQIEVTVSPADRTFPAGQEVVLTVTAEGSAERPPSVLSLRVDGEPVEQDPARSCVPPSSPPPRSPQRAERRFTVVLSEGEHVLEAVADDGCSWYRGRARVTYTVTAS